MLTITIERVPHNGNIIIKHNEHSYIFCDYTERQALQLFRSQHALRYKKLEIIRI